MKKLLSLFLALLMFSFLSSCNKEMKEPQSEITVSQNDTAIGEQKQKEQLDNEKQEDSQDKPQKAPFKKEDITALIGTTAAKYTVGEDRTVGIIGMSKFRGGFRTPTYASVCGKF